MALCQYNGGGKDAPIFPVSGCMPEDGVTCVLEPETTEGMEKLLAVIG